ncbi:MAG: polysaccharide deacetylase family protein [Acidobacteriota bacterium]|nr:polysaccharide deacetylase family protein [Acidobacteriota bacterium]
MSKRLLVARSLEMLGALRILEGLRNRPGVLVLNYHRIGQRSSSNFDRQIFSATADEFDAQLRYLKQHFSVVTPDELQQLVDGTLPVSDLHIAITFDDGYLDNYTTAFPVLQSNGCKAIFFLVADYVGSTTVPWWDEIAYLVRNTQKSKLHLSWPQPLLVELEGDHETAIRTVLQHFKRSDNRNSALFLEQLREITAVQLPHRSRRFLSWEEAREMQRAGMMIGSHTQTHPILGQITADRQSWELSESKQLMESLLGSPITSLAYPVGTRDGFDATTESLAHSLGYRMCFSFYGGINLPGSMRATNLLRTNTNEHLALFHAETLLLAKLGTSFS